MNVFRCSNCGLTSREVNTNVSEEHAASIFRVVSKIDAACPSETFIPPSRHHQLFDGIIMQRW
jgi:hypothetical protein